MVHVIVKYRFEGLCSSFGKFSFKKIKTRGLDFLMTFSVSNADKKTKFYLIKRTGNFSTNKIDVTNLSFFIIF